MFLVSVIWNLTIIMSKVKTCFLASLVPYILSLKSVLVFPCMSLLLPWFSSWSSCVLTLALALLESWDHISVFDDLVLIITDSNALLKSHV